MRQAERRASKALQANPVGTLALLGVLTLVVGWASLSFAVRQMNAASVRDERARVAAAVTGRWLGMAEALVAAGRGDAPYPLAANPVRHGRDMLDAVARIEPGTPPVFLRPPGTDAPGEDVRAAVAKLAPPAFLEPGQKLRTMVAAGGGTFAALVLPWEAPGAAPASPGGRALAVGLVTIDRALLAELSFAADTRALRLIGPGEPVDADSPTYPIDDASGLRLAWTPETPGDHLMMEGTTIIVALTSLFAALVTVRARRLAGKARADGAEATTASNHDWLSGLPNRVFLGHALDVELNQIKSARKMIGLFYLDLDRFKDVNDAFGIETGDRMIQIATQRIANVVRRGDLVARFEGDAFMIMQRDIRGPRDCELLAERIQGVLREPFDINGSRINVSASIGVALAPGDATERSELMRLANLALYRAKREGRNRVAFYKPVLEDEWRRRNAIELELRHAIEHHGLVLHYQPIVSSASGRVVGVEALVRWNHPAEGLIAPEDFISLAEDRGLIIPLGEWVLHQACTDARRLRGLRIAVNVSPIQFRQPAFVASVGRILSETGLEPSRLELELTEGVVVDNENEAVAAMDQLRDKGVRLALDDFGTGYSSLIYLRRFAFDKIKIDRAFIEALEPSGESAILVDSVVRLGRALGLTVTAEGVETEEQIAFLKGLECPELQGYLISRPLPLNAMCAFLDHHGPAIDAGEANAIRAVA